jgi:hypothetical protein
MARSVFVGGVKKLTGFDGVKLIQLLSGKLI